MTRKSTALNDRLFTTHSVFRLRRRIAAQDKVLNRTLRELQHFDYDGSYQDMDLAKGSHRSVCKPSWELSFSHYFQSRLFLHEVSFIKSLRNLPFVAFS